MTMNSSTNRCRNCGETGRVHELGFKGQLAPFFLKRVYGIRLGTVSSTTPWKRIIQRMAQFPKTMLDRLGQPTAVVEMQLCEVCNFIQTKRPFHEEDITRLYLDYREESYNRERTEMEPSYAQIAGDVGQSVVELETRLTAATRFLKEHMPVGKDFSILDFGGSDGKFMPRIEGRKFVFEISNVQPIEGVTRVHSEAELGTYSLVQLAHVVEHVVEPLGLVKHVAERVAPGGYLYVETPQELTTEEREEVMQGRRMVNIHEHINSFCVEAVTKLIEGAGLRVVAVEATPVNVGWATAVHLRALGQKI